MAIVEAERTLFAKHSGANAVVEANKNSSGKIPQWVGIGTGLVMAAGGFLILVGLVLIGSGLWSYRNAHQFAQTARSTQGTVIELVRSTYKDRERDRGFSKEASSRTWCPVIEFIDHHGAVNEFQLDLCTNPASYQRGEQVTVLYAEDSPHQVKLKDQSMYATAYILAGLSAIFIFIGMCWFFAGFFAKKWLYRKYRTATVA